jgi:hypothetical protein
MFCCYGVFKVRADRVREKAIQQRDGLSKLNSVTPQPLGQPRCGCLAANGAEVDMIPGEPRHRTIASDHQP